MIAGYNGILTLVELLGLRLLHCGVEGILAITIASFDIRVFNQEIM